MSLFDAGILSRVSDILSRLTQRYSRQNSKPKQNTYHYLKSIKLMWECNATFALRLGGRHFNGPRCMGIWKWSKSCWKLVPMSMQRIRCLDCWVRKRQWVSTGHDVRLMCRIFFFGWDIQQDGNTAMNCASIKGHLTTAEALIATANVNAINGVIWFETNKRKFVWLWPVLSYCRAATRRCTTPHAMVTRSCASCCSGPRLTWRRKIWWEKLSP